MCGADGHFVVASDQSLSILGNTHSNTVTDEIMSAVVTALTLWIRSIRSNLVDKVNQMHGSFCLFGLVLLINRAC